MTGTTIEVSMGFPLSLFSLLNKITFFGANFIAG
jgi:hypothetical protein